ncbi:MAG: glycosyltransferase family 2 protein [Chitinophagaceae bacterium]
MDQLKFLFWLLLAILFYTYIGYALIVIVNNLFKKHSFKRSDLQDWMEVTFVVASYNEEKILTQKIENTLSLNYPSGKLKFIVVTDGSDDGSVNIVKQYQQQVFLLHSPERRGKAAAMNHAMQHVQTSIVIFSDANCLLNKDSVQHMMKHFIGDKVGAVAGEKKITRSTGFGSAEGWYWKYESWMKKMDAALYSVVGASGELFAMRTNLFEPLDENTLLDDFMLSAYVCLQGYVIAYEPKAYAVEFPSASLYDEQNRKVRIAAGAFQALSKINFQTLIKQPLLLAFQFFSRRWLRWVVCPFAIIAVFVLNASLSALPGKDIYDYFFITQIIFYIAAVLGALLMRHNKTFILTTIPFYFLFMNFCMLQGLLLFLQKKQTVLWPKTERVT